MPTRRPPELSDDYELTYRIVPMPADTNYRGDIFGGWLMGQVDIAGSILALAESGGRVATVAVKEFLFLAPVMVGDIISCYARVTRIGRTSITVHVEVFVGRQKAQFELKRVAEATLVYVALDEQGEPRLVNPA